MSRPISIAIALTGILLLGASRQAQAGAVLRPADSTYPMRLLRQTAEELTVDIHGLVSETKAYAEFRNDRDRPVDAVYSFSMPADAHATRLLYSKGDSVLEAGLKEVPQSTVPGRGEGGFAAELDAYLGKNKVSLELKAIPAGGTQRVEIRYVQRAQLEAGRITYRHPLALGAFLPEAVANLRITVNLHKDWTASGYGSPSHPGPWQVLRDDANELSVRFEKAKAFLVQDFEWSYAPGNAEQALSTRSCKKADSAGFMAASLLPPSSPAPARARSVLFLLDMSRSMTGFKQQQSAAAIKASLSSLGAGDRFAIGAFDGAHSLVLPFRSADADSKEAAAAILDSLEDRIGIGATNLREGVNGALESVPDDGTMGQVFLFSDGFSTFKPEEIRNPRSIQVHVLGLGRDVNRARLETLAAGNQGIALFLPEEDAILAKVAALVADAGRPNLTSAKLEPDSGGLTQIIQPGTATLFGWGGWVFASRYGNAGASSFTLQGQAAGGKVTMNLSAALTGDSLDAEARIAQRFWAAARIRELENKIDVYGIDQASRQEAVRISLLHKVKSRYTSYWTSGENAPGPTDPGGPATMVKTGRAKDAKARLQVKTISGLGGLEIQVQLAGTTGNEEILLAVYDVHGRLVRLLRKGMVTGAEVHATWDGLDAAGKAVSGPVVLILKEGGRISLSRMVTRNSTMP